MAKVRANPKFHLEKSDGTPASGWKIYTYIAGTSTAKDTYTDNTEATPNTNPVILDANGNADIWWAGTYKVIVKDDTDVTQWTVDNYGAGEDASLTGNFNLIKNDSFEIDTITSGEPDNWTIVDYTDGVHSLDSTDQYHGLNSLKFTSVGTGGGYATSDYFEVREGLQITVDWMMKSTVADVRNVVDILWYTSAKTLISTTNLYDDSTTNPTSWTEKSGSATPPSTSRYAQVRLYGCHSSDATSGSTWFDNIKGTEDFIGDIIGDVTGNLTGDAIITDLFIDAPTTAGTGSAYTVTVGETSYTANRIYRAQIHTDNLGACTINFDSLGNKNIKTISGSDPAAGMLKDGMEAVFIYDATNMVIINPNTLPYIFDGSSDFSYYGNGSDGAVTISTNTNYDPGEYHFTNFTVNSGITFGLNSQGYLILRCTGTCTINGTIDVDGDGGAGGAAGGIGAAGSAGEASSWGGTGGGGGGGTAGGAGGVGGDSTLRVLSISGGTAGAVGGNGGNGTAFTARMGKAIYSNASAILGLGGSGGGGGGGSSGAAGSAGGNGGGTIIIIAPVIVIDAAGVLTADGNNGTALGGGNGGTGAGGGGGTVILAGASITDSGTTTVTGGTGATPPGTGGTGGNGGAGYTATIQLN